MAQSAIGRIRKLLFSIFRAPIRLFLGQVLRDEDTHAWLKHTMGNELAMNDRTLREDVPAGLVSIRGFEDCYWLYSSNPLNHGASRLRFDEAAYLFRLVSDLDAPKVVEIGRYKGGTTFLLAAAGAQVISLDNGGIPGQDRFTNALNDVLVQFQLRERARAVIADALAYPVEACAYDLVILDHGLDDFEMGRKLFEHWWGAVRPDGYFLFRDGKNTVLSELARYVSTLNEDEIGGRIDRDLPGAFVLCHKSRSIV